MKIFTVASSPEGTVYKTTSLSRLDVFNELTNPDLPVGSSRT